MDDRMRSRIEVLGAAALFSTGGLAIKATSLSGLEVAPLRSALGALTLVLLIPGARRGWTRGVWLVAVPYAATLFLYVQSNKLTTAANAIFLQSTAPIYLLLLSPLLLHERIRKGEILYLAAMATGMALFFAGFEPPQRTAPNPAFGNVLAALSGPTWALTVLGLRALARNEGPGGGSPVGRAAAAAAAGNVLVVLGCLPFVWPVGPFLVKDVLWVLYLGVVQIGLAYVLLTRGVRRVTALEGGLLLLLEPVLNTLGTWAVHGEVPGVWSRAGALVILSATAVHTLLTRR